VEADTYTAELELPVILVRPEPQRVYCGECSHSEFVHGDIAARRCLYSECQCGGFTLRSVSKDLG
jgi:hypothetical protein